MVSSKSENNKTQPIKEKKEKERDWKKERDTFQGEREKLNI